MKLSIEDQRIWALGLTLVIVLMAGILLFPPSQTATTYQGAPSQGGLTELVVGIVTFALGSAAS